MRSILSRIAVLSLCAILHPATVLAQWSDIPCSPVRVCTATMMQRDPVAVPDGEGGALIAWVDQRDAGTNGYDIYITHLLANGVLDPAWTPGGTPVCQANSDQTGLVIATDGAGGAFLAWQDLRNSGTGMDVYGSRILSDGTVAPGWTPGGTALGVNAGVDSLPRICPDGVGGLYVAWQWHFMGADHDPMLTRLSSSGQAMPGFTLGGGPIAWTGMTEDRPVPVATADGGCLVAYQSNANGTYDIVVQAVTFDGNIGLTTTLCNEAGDQTDPVAISDGAGGALVAWNDRRGVDTDIYARRVLPNGRAAQGFAAGGLLVGGGEGDQSLVSLVTDGAGGAYLMWTRSLPTWVSRFTGTGTIPVGWTTDGVQLFGVTGFAGIAADGAGGLLTVEHTMGVSDFSVIAKRFLADASPAPGWPAGGVAICQEYVGPYSLWNAVACPDGRGGVIATYVGSWDSGAYDLLAGRVEGFGHLGGPEPSITSVGDVRGDQGGRVRVAWTRSTLDAAPGYAVGSYRLWREVPAEFATAALTTGVRRMALSGEDSQASGAPLLRTTLDAVGTHYWEHVGTQVAAAMPGYSLVTATTCDSVAGSNPLTRFMVEAVATTAPGWWTSMADSGYSVDDLAPAAPVPFTGTWTPSGTALAWGSNVEPDLAGYRLYRGTSAGFVPSPANLVTQQDDPGYFDAGAPTAYYRLSAVDVHGNESATTLLLPNGTLDTPQGPLPAELALAPVTPNPLRGVGLIAYDLPRAAQVSLAVFDAQGRRVRTLVEGTQPAGNRTARWDGRDESGAVVGSGVYFVLMSVEDHRFIRRIAFIR